MFVIIRERIDFGGINRGDVNSRSIGGITGIAHGFSCPATPGFGNAVGVDQEAQTERQRRLWVRFGLAALALEKHVDKLNRYLEADGFKTSRATSLDSVSSRCPTSGSTRFSTIAPARRKSCAGHGAVIEGESPLWDQSEATVGERQLHEPARATEVAEARLAADRRRYEK